jgi:hypothetical protein
LISTSSIDGKKTLYSIALITHTHTLFCNSLQYSPLFLAFSKNKKFQKSFGFLRHRPKGGRFDWLKPGLQNYAAADAWATLAVYHKSLEMAKEE